MFIMSAFCDNDKSIDGFHTSVMVKEVIENLITDRRGIYVDCTFGGGGHSIEILKNLDNNARLIAFDQDKDVINNIKKINDIRLEFINSNFRYISNYLKYLVVEKVDGIFADLGVSSYQIDTPERGFSIRFDGKLDMRMNIGLKKTAFDVVNIYSIEDLIYIFKTYGELNNADEISRLIVRNRRLKKIETTMQLVDIVLKCINISRINKNKFLAKVFQALRIEVNDELKSLEILLKKSIGFLKNGGRLVLLSYHSLEDRIIKNFFKSNKSIISLYKKPLIPSSNEIISNSRSRSAKLRIGVKIN